MKKSYVVLILAAICVQNTFAKADSTSSIIPQNGYYKGSDITVCGVQIEMNEQTGELVEQSAGCSSSPGDMNVYKRLSANQFVNISGVSPYTDQDIAKCAPTSDNPKPCGDLLYDSQTGKLLIQVGDIAQYEQIVTMMNSTSMVFNPTQVVATRGSTVLAKWDANLDGQISAPILMYWASDAAPTYHPHYVNNGGGVSIHNVSTGG